MIIFTISKIIASVIISIAVAIATIYQNPDIKTSSLLVLIAVWSVFSMLASYFLGGFAKQNSNKSLATSVIAFVISIVIGILVTNVTANLAITSNNVTKVVVAPVVLPKDNELHEASVHTAKTAIQLEILAPDALESAEAITDVGQASETAGTPPKTYIQIVDESPTYFFLMLELISFALASLIFFAVSGIRAILR